ncbi:MAG TPA: MbnP family protein [Verrucomicrobiae bacterium]|nr:MbnP family protein [Verrucomicrobiae bacterium]
MKWLRLSAFLGALLCLRLTAAELGLRFDPTFNGAPRLAGSLRYPLPGGETISITRLSCLLGGFALEKPAAGWVELTNQFAWLDLEKRRNAFLLNSIPAGDYRALRFSVGLSPVENSSDPALYGPEHPLNPNLDGLRWSWQGGYIFLALEGMYRTAEGPLRGFSYHFARTTNRTVINIPVTLRIADSAKINGLAMNFDVGSLLNAPRPISPARDGASTHSRDGDPIAASLRANLPGAFQFRQIAASARASARPATKPLYLPAHYTPFRFQMSPKFPIPDLPKDNPLLVERVDLGRRLFSDPRLSRDNTISCASCHDPTHAFSDPRQFSVGVSGRSGARNAMPLFNLAWKSSFFWDGRASSPRQQAMVPIQDHSEMDESLTNLVVKLKNARDYWDMFARAFGTPQITPEKIGLALENYVLTITSFDSKFDRAMSGRAELSAQEKQGAELFFTEFDPRMDQRGADCFHCHGGALFTDNQFHNNGLEGPNPSDPGRYRVTHNPLDEGRFSTPSLRNVALTAPYMHDGRFETLAQVIDHYSTGVKPSATLDPNLAKHPLTGLQLTTAEKQALVAFLKTLTDEKFAGPAVASGRPAHSISP